MELVDTHCHLTFRRYDHDRAEVLKRARGAGVQRIIIPAIDVASGRQASRAGGARTRSSLPPSASIPIIAPISMNP